MSNENTDKARQEPYPRWFVWYLRLFLVVVVVAVAFWTRAWLIDTAPTNARRPSGERTAIIEARSLRQESKQVTIQSTGSVIPVRELNLRARVGGEVIEIHPDLEPGGRLKADDVVLRLNEEDYKLALSQAEASLRDAEEQLKQIEIQEENLRKSLTITKRSVELSQSELDRIGSLLRSKTSSQSTYETQEKVVLGLRGQAVSIENSLRLIPAQRITARAKMDQAKANVEQARLDLERTVVRCPFNAVVTARLVTLGAQVGAQTDLARIVDTDAYWVEVPLPPDRLPWIALPNGSNPGASAIVTPSGANSDGTRWSGTVTRRQPSIEEQGRLARLLIRVENPLEAGAVPLLLGSFVHVEIAGPTLENVFILPRDTIHNGQDVWLLNGQGRLEVRQATPIWNDEDVFVVRDGLSEGERLVLTDIASPIPGMKLDLPEEAAKKLQAAEQNGKPGGGPGGKSRPSSSGAPKPSGPSPKTKGGLGNG